VKDNKSIARQTLLNLAEREDEESENSERAARDYESSTKTCRVKAEKSEDLAELYRRLADAVNQ